ncbi:phosphate regulon sensor histidine kinase PhoR [Comamonas nitrativorans]|uniref:Phosphate regulon sensor protein PhoR n=1 Tax=Comamonas nitrativorans TaxID=108437 RepID=A0ABV9GRU0_9BURK
MNALWQRWLALVLAQAALAAVGAWLAGWGGALAAALLGSWLWLLWDNWQAGQLWRWLQTGRLAAVPRLHGLWGGLSASARRWLRAKEQTAQTARQRVQGMLHALQASPNGLILLDAHGQIEWCNRMAEGHFGLQAERDLGQALGHLVRDPALLTYWHEGDFSQPLTLDGSQGARLSVQLYPYGDGQHLLLARDVTALEQAEAMRREFVANVSHEIRTPLTVLVGFVETLQTLELEAEQRQRYLHLMGQQAQRMHHLVQDLLTLSRLEGSPLPGYDQSVGVAAILQQCEVEARALSALLCQQGQQGEAAHRLEFPAPDAPGMDGELLGVQVELVSAFSNLITNALRYTPAGGQVQVRWLPQPDGSARLQVRDTGPGIAPEHLARLTERFYRIDRSRSRETGGTGLGLAIVKHALQRHGAQLHIESQLGQGSTFTVHFPARRIRPDLS